MKKIKFIAELAQGYEGKFSQACELIKGAKLAMADFAKIQVVYADELATNDYKDYKIFKSLELNKHDWKKIFRYSQKLEIKLIAEVFGRKSLETAKFMGVDFLKLHPTDINNFNLISEIKKLNPKKIFIGIGGAKKNEIKLCLEELSGFKVVLLHGHQVLPTPNHDLNIARISKILSYFKNVNKNYDVGIADHVVPGDKDQITIIAMAIAAGALYVEKHLTTNRVFELEDYQSALNPDELRELIKKCKNLKKIFGNDNFYLNRSEKKYRELTRRVPLTKKNLNKGSIIDSSNMVFKRSLLITDIKDINSVFGKKLKRKILKNKVLYKKDFL